MPVVVYIVVILLALVPQIVFTFLYWRWIPAWTKNSYGRLAQLDSWSQILFLSAILSFITIGTDWGVEARRTTLAICLIPFAILGVFRLILLKRAVDSAKSHNTEGDSEQ